MTGWRKDLFGELFGFTGKSLKHQKHVIRGKECLKGYMNIREASTPLEVGSQNVILMNMQNTSRLEKHVGAMTKERYVVGYVFYILIIYRGHGSIRL